MTQEWLSLSEVAKLLGVHPSTVRSWSDRGAVPTHRTQGGHRRYLRSEIELWRQSQSSSADLDVNLVVQNALRTTRMQISEGRLFSEAWYQKLDDDAKEQYRRSGRSLLQGLINYIHSDDEKATAEAESIGYEYASRGRRCGLDSVEAASALMFFRNMLMESMLGVYESAAIRTPHAWSNMFRKINDFTDEILVTILETYDAYQKNSR